MKTTSEFLEILAPPLAHPTDSSNALVGWPFKAKHLRGISSGGKKPSVKGLAYSGGKMRLFGWSRPVVVDMAGINIPESVSLLTNHVNAVCQARDTRRATCQVPATSRGELLLNIVGSPLGKLAIIHDSI